MNITIREKMKTEYRKLISEYEKTIIIEEDVAKDNTVTARWEMPTLLLTLLCISLRVLVICTPLGMSLLL